MLRNLTTETDLKGYAVRLTNLLGTGETDYSKQKEKATQFVFNQLLQKRYDVKQLMPEMVLRASGTSITADEDTTAVEDTINRLRIVIDNITNTTSAKTITLQGSDTEDGTFTDVTTVTVATADTLQTVTFTDTYKFYRLNTAVISGAIDYRAYLTETVYDELFGCKWLVFILADIRKSEGDQFDLKMQYYENMYNDLMNSAMLYIDTNADGVPDVSRETNIINVTR